jgi:methyltransferase OMS1, mitochondrial
MASNLARQAPFIAAAGGIYFAACFIGYRTIRRNRADIDETLRALHDGSYSFVADPKRTEQFNCVADRYDDQIGRDEIVMGINLMRRSLLYFHAKGTVLEVGAGTGRNVGELCLRLTDDRRMC